MVPILRFLLLGANLGRSFLCKVVHKCLVQIRLLLGAKLGPGWRLKKPAGIHTKIRRKNDHLIIYENLVWIPAGKN